MLSVPRIPGGETREDRALELYAGLGRHIQKIGEGLFEVPSQDGRRTYEVHYGGELESCSCPDSTYRGAVCVHLLAVGIRHARRRKPRSHIFTCSGCESRHPLRKAVVVGADEAAFSLFAEGELVCEPCSRLHGVR